MRNFGVALFRAYSIKCKKGLCSFKADNVLCPHCLLCVEDKKSLFDYELQENSNLYYTKSIYKECQQNDTAYRKHKHMYWKYFIVS